jgi:tetratricopeptide (TPR) repeat protein
VLLLKWRNELDSKKFQEVADEIYSFLQRRPNSPHWYGVLFVYGRAKEGVEDWSGAIQIYQQIVQRSTDRQMEFVALAYYRTAYCFEVLLDNEKALSALTDALRLQSYLPMEIYLAEIPARIASVHARLNQPVLADIFTKKAEKGINQLRAIKRDADPEWMSRTLVKMGGISLTQVDEENFRQNILTLERNQRYLIQAIELNHPSWGPEAQKALFSTYTNLLAFIESFKTLPTSDIEADLVAEASKKSDFLSWYLEAIERAKTFEAPEESPAFLRTAEVYHQIKLLETKAQALLNQELLKKPWPLPTSRTTSSFVPSLNSSSLSVALLLESSKNTEFHSRNLPRKKPK